MSEVCVYEANDNSHPIWLHNSGAQIISRTARDRKEISFTTRVWWWNNWQNIESRCELTWWKLIKKYWQHLAMEKRKKSKSHLVNITASQGQRTEIDIYCWSYNLLETISFYVRNANENVKLVEMRLMLMLWDYRLDFIVIGLLLSRKTSRKLCLGINLKTFYSESAKKNIFDFIHVFNTSKTYLLAR